MNNDFKLIAHRGYHLKSKENTLFSFESAIKNNFYGFECDVRETKDGFFAIFHDSIINGKLFKNVNYKDIKKDVPLLESVLKINTNKIILIEIKDPFININNFKKILNKYHNKNIYVMSFYQNVIEKLNDKNKSYKVGILNYILNTNIKHFKYDFICILNSIINKKIIDFIYNNKQELFIYGIIKKEFIYKLPYYIVD